MSKSKILANSHYVTDIPVSRLNFLLKEYTDGEVIVQPKKEKDYYHFHIYMGKYNIPCEILIGNMLNVRIIDIAYEGNENIRIIYDTI